MPNPEQDLNETAEASNRIEASMKGLLENANRTTGLLGKIQTTSEAIFDQLQKGETEGGGIGGGKAKTGKGKKEEEHPLKKDFPWLFGKGGGQGGESTGGEGPGPGANVRKWLSGGKAPPNQGGTAEELAAGRGAGSGRMWAFMHGAGFSNQRGAAVAEAESEAGKEGLGSAAGAGAAVAGGIGGIAKGAFDTNALTGMGKVAGGAGMAAGGALSMIPGVGPVLGAVAMGLGKLGQAALEAVDKLRKWGDALHQKNAQFAEYSPRMAAVMARQEVRDIQYSHDRGEAMADSAEQLEQARSNMRDSLAPLENFWANMQNKLGSGLMNGTAVPFDIATGSGSGTGTGVGSETPTDRPGMGSGAGSDFGPNPVTNYGRPGHFGVAP